METLGLADFLQPELTALNRLPMRAPLPYFTDASAALKGSRYRRRKSLDGQWKFALFPSPDQAGLSIADAAFDHHVAVPGCWTMDEAVDDWPHYTNIVMPWPGLDAPETPERNPVGVYRTTFDLAAGWLKDDVVLHLGGFESVAAVWCNETFVGMSKDSRLAAEFLLNGAAVAGANQINIAVVRYSDATWIEDQDHWWHGGLHRSVFVEARPTNRIDDVSVVADFDPKSGLGSLQVSGRATGKDAATMRVTLHPHQAAARTAAASVSGSVQGDPTGLATGGPVTASSPIPIPPDGAPLEQLVTSYTYPGRVGSVSIDGLEVKPWTAETPNRYLAVVELVDPKGRSLSVNTVPVGFRRVEVRDRRFLVNGIPIVFHGVNRHDHHPDTGKVQSEQDIRADLESMKRLNIDAVRCAHYPNDPVLLDLCDELGLWVIDEANVECHGRLRSVADDPRYLNAIVDRVTRMVIRDRNHPSVVAWSLGNESGHGIAHDACASWVRTADPTRPLHYEGAMQQRFLVEQADAELACTPPSVRERAVSDLVCPMYTAIEVVEAWAEWAEETGLDDRPLVLCEFSHAMGNSNGGFDRYAEAFHRWPALAGGFVWDWKDQGLRAVDADGAEFWAYGGHYGDEPNDANFCINGIVGPDGTPHPAAAEIAWGYQPVRVSHRGGRKVNIANRRAFIDLGDLSGSWQLVIDGELVEQGPLDVNVKPGGSLNHSVPYSAPIKGADDVELQFRWVDGSGRTAARDQVVLRQAKATDLSVLDPKLLANIEPLETPASTHRSVTEPVGPVWLSCGPSRMRVDQTFGVDRILLGERSVLATAIKPSLWRAPTDNDGVAQGWMSDVAGVRNRWLALGLDAFEWPQVSTSLFTGPDASLAIVDRIAGDTCWTTKVVLTEHAVTVDECVNLGESLVDVARVGTSFSVNPGLGHLRWFGLGPQETYPDRLAGARSGIWDSAVEAQYHPYVVPQEHGAHQRTRWFELSAPDGTGLRFCAQNPVSFSARRHGDAALTAAKTTAELQLGDVIEVHVDACQRGLGTGACGPDTASQFRIPAGEHRWRFTIAPIAPIAPIANVAGLS